MTISLSGVAMLLQAAAVHADNDLCKILDPSYAGASKTTTCPCGFFPKNAQGIPKRWKNCNGGTTAQNVINLEAGTYTLDQAYPGGSDFPPKNASAFSGVTGAQIYGDITIVGAGKGKTIIDGGLTGRLFQTAPGVTLTLKDLTLTKGKPLGMLGMTTIFMGGAIACFGDKTVCSFEQVEFSENNGGCCGGALKLGDDRYKQDVTVKLKDCDFSKNTVGDEHASLYCDDASGNYGGADICGYTASPGMLGTTDPGSTFNIFSFQSLSTTFGTQALATGISSTTKRNPLRFKTCADLQASESDWTCPEGTKCGDGSEFCSPAADGQHSSGPGFCPATQPSWASSLGTCQCALAGKFGPTCLSPTPAPTKPPTFPPPTPAKPTPKPPPTPKLPTPKPTLSPTYVTCLERKIDSPDKCNAACQPCNFNTPQGCVGSVSCNSRNGAASCSICKCSNGAVLCEDAPKPGPGPGPGGKDGKRLSGMGTALGAVAGVAVVGGALFLLYLNREQVRGRLGMEGPFDREPPLDATELEAPLAPPSAGLAEEADYHQQRRR
jgi:hypothetical protein